MFGLGRGILLSLAMRYYEPELQEVRVIAQGAAKMTIFAAEVGLFLC